MGASGQNTPVTESTSGSNKVGKEQRGGEQQLNSFLTCSSFLWRSSLGLTAWGRGLTELLLSVRFAHSHEVRTRALVPPRSGAVGRPGSTCRKGFVESGMG